MVCVCVWLPDFHSDQANGHKSLLCHKHLWRFVLQHSSSFPLFQRGLHPNDGHALQSSLDLRPQVEGPTLSTLVVAAVVFLDPLLWHTSFSCQAKGVALLKFSPSSCQGLPLPPGVTFLKVYTLLLACQRGPGGWEPLKHYKWLVKTKKAGNET